MYCRNCGAKHADGDRFCAYCGVSIDGDVNLNTPYQQPLVNNYQPSQVELSTVNTNKSIIALVFSIIGFILCFPGVASSNSPMTIDVRDFLIIRAFFFTGITVVGLIFGILSINFAKNAKKSEKRSTRSLVFGIVSVCLASYALLLNLVMLINLTTSSVYTISY